MFEEIYITFGAALGDAIKEIIVVAIKWVAGLERVNGKGLRAIYCWCYLQIV